MARSKPASSPRVARDSDGRSERSRALRDLAEQSGAVGTWEWTLESGKTVWSDNLFRLYGFETGEVEPGPELALARVHRDDRERFAAEVEQIRRGGAAPGSTSGSCDPTARCDICAGSFARSSGLAVSGG